MISLAKLMEGDEKAIGNMSFQTYECIFIIKCLKKYNKSDILERVRGIKNVTIVETVPSAHLDTVNKKSKKDEFSLLRIAFISNQKPEDEIDDITFAMLKHDRDNVNIIGLVSAKPKLDTLKKK